MSTASLPRKQSVREERSIPAQQSFTTRFSLPLLLGAPVPASLVLLVVPLIVLQRFSFLVSIPGRGLSDQTTLANYTVFATDAFYRGYRRDDCNRPTDHRYLPGTGIPGRLRLRAHKFRPQGFAAHRHPVALLHRHPGADLCLDGATRPQRTDRPGAAGCRTGQALLGPVWPSAMHAVFGVDGLRAHLLTLVGMLVAVPGLVVQARSSSAS